MATEFTFGGGSGESSQHYVLQEAIGMYSDEEYTTAKKLSGTELVSTNDEIDTEGETFIGQMRWNKPLNPVINVASLTDSTDGTPTDSESEYLRYIKTVRTHGANKINLTKVVSKQDGLAKIGRDFAITRAQDEHNAILSTLKGVALAEALYGAAAASGSAGLGGQTFENDPTDKRYGFYVDLGADGLVTDATTTSQGAQRAEGFLQAIGMAYKDYEPDYAYLVTSPAVLASLRSANLVDNDKVVDGNVEFNTLFSGKFRIVLTRATQSFTTAEITKINTGAGVDIAGSLTSFIVLPGAVNMNALTIDEDVEITRRGAAYKGGGVTDIWYRWGYVAHPAGYNWIGAESDFPSDADFMNVVESGTPKALGTATDALADTTGTWERKFTSALSLGILPVFHS
jgi:hypothetical protein